FKVVAYINTTAALKAVCDVCVTSSSALKIVDALEEKDILFIPDKNLGSFVKEKLPHKNVILWDGYCPVHNAITVKECEEAKKLHPNAKILMHPELPAEVLKYADLIGSTADILNFAKNTNEECIIGTENQIADFLSQNNPNGKYYKLSKNLFCADMRLTSLIDVYHAVKGDGGFEVTLSNELLISAKKPITEMIRLGN
ncbi:MAG: quinolinate synthase NadA, partial [Oscillospiraceae bacterium]